MSRSRARVAAEKAAWRERFHAVRQSLAPEVRAEASAAIVEKFPYPKLFAVKDVRDLLRSTRRHVVPLMEHLDAVDSAVETVGATNTVVIREGRTKGYNTDIDGFRAAIKPFLAHGMERALILGTGGASKAVRYVLENLGIETLTATRYPAEKGGIGYDQLNENAVKFHRLIVNATPLGTWFDHHVYSFVASLGRVLRKLRIDELPQIINVFQGKMSLVGPRPERPEFVNELAKTIPFYPERHTVKPGITGWAQLKYQYGSSEQDAVEKLQYDLFYVKNHNLLLDLAIMLQTAEVILWGKGAR